MRESPEEKQEKNEKKSPFEGFQLDASEVFCDFYSCQNISIIKL
jgi:hypothetical protein